MRGWCFRHVSPPCHGPGRLFVCSRLPRPPTLYSNCPPWIFTSRKLVPHACFILTYFSIALPTRNTVYLLHVYRPSKNSTRWNTTMRLDVFPILLHRCIGHTGFVTADANSFSPRVQRRFNVFCITSKKTEKLRMCEYHFEVTFILPSRLIKISQTRRYLLH